MAATTAPGWHRTAANPEDVRATNVLAKVGWNYKEDARLGLVYEKYKDDRDTDQKSAYGGPFFGGQPTIPANILPGGMYQWRTGNDTITRERFGLEHSFALDSLLVDNVKWSLNHQIAKTDQSTEEFYYPMSRKVLRTRDTVYEEKQWVFDAQLDKTFSLADTEHLLTYGTTLKQQKVTGSRSGNGTCLAVFGSCRVVGATSAADVLKKSSDFPDPTINTYSLFAQDQISWNQSTSCLACATTTPNSSRTLPGNSSTPWRPTVAAPSATRTRPGTRCRPSSA